jgi:cell division protein FtsL
MTWIVFMAFFMTGLLFYTWCRVQCTKIGYEITREKEHQRTLYAYQKNLKIELARLKSPERISAIARERLGLVMPNTEQMILIP